MDGKTLLRSLRMLLDEDSNSGFLDSFTSYQLIHRAAIDFVDRTKCLRTTQSVTTVADQSAYSLNGDFMGFYLRDDYKRNFIKYNDGSNDYFLYLRPYDDIILSNQTTSVATPSRFAVTDNATLPSRVTGTATSAGASSGGECTLTDSAGDFSDVQAGDFVHNTTDGSHGIVIETNSSTSLVTALFDGTNNDWTGSDAYVIQPQGRSKIVLDPPPSTANHTVTVYYVQRPAPVYSDYGVYRFAQHYSDALVSYAAWLYKYRESEPNFGDKWYVIYDAAVRRNANQVNNIFRKNRIDVRLKARGL